MSQQVFTVDQNGIITGIEPIQLVGVPAVFVFTPTGVNIDAAQLIPLRSIDSQQFSVTLSNQVCTFLVYTKSILVPFVPSGGIPTDPPVYKRINPIFLDLYINDALLLGGVLCLNQNLIVRNAYLGFIGDLSFIDTVANEDPQVSGLGTRWQLAYWPNLNQR